MRINNATPVMSQAVMNKNKNNSQNVAFSGAKANAFTDSCSKLFELTRKGTFSRALFVTNAYVFLLGSRLVTSRDNNERRETLTRDVPTIFIAVQGLPIIKNLVAKQIQKKTGFAITQETGTAAKKSTETISSSQVGDWYHFDDKLVGSTDGKASGFDRFVERLEQKGGNLKKIFSSLSDDIKTQLSGLKDENADIKTELSKNAELKSKIELAFKDGKNKAMAKAAWLKTIPTILGFALTLGLIGIFIPKLNIAITEKISKNKKAEESQKTDKPA